MISKGVILGDNYFSLNFYFEKKSGKNYWNFYSLSFWVSLFIVFYINLNLTNSNSLSNRRHLWTLFIKL